MSKDRITTSSGLYHAYNRGNNKEMIFKDAIDKTFFLMLLVKYMIIYDIIIYAYCLMGNHFHLFIDDIKNNLSAFMREVQSKYADYYNKRHNRTGHVFQGRFGSMCVIGYKYCTTLIRYIFRNPIKAGISRGLSEYKWTSLGESNKLHHITDLKDVEVLFQNAGKNMFEFLSNDEDDDLISILERRKMCDAEAYQKFVEIVKNDYQYEVKDFLMLDMEIKFQIIMKCRYIGITIKQLQDFTHLNQWFIRRATPRDIKYIVPQDPE